MSRVGGGDDDRGRHDGDAGADHDAAGRPVDAANDLGRAQELAGAAGEEDMPADHDDLHGEDHVCELEDLAQGDRRSDDVRQKGDIEQRHLRIAEIEGEARRADRQEAASFGDWLHLGNDRLGRPEPDAHEDEIGGAAIAQDRHDDPHSSAATIQSPNAASVRKSRMPTTVPIP